MSKPIPSLPYRLFWLARELLWRLGIGRRYSQPKYSRADMDAELKASVVPWLRLQGFVGSLPYFRRNRAAAVDLLTFQFDKYGGGFIIEIARCLPDGILNGQGDYISLSKARTWHIDPPHRRRLAPYGPSPRGWFRFDRDPPQKVATQVITELSNDAIWDDLGPAMIQARPGADEG